MLKKQMITSLMMMGLGIFMPNIMAQSYPQYNSWWQQENQEDSMLDQPANPTAADSVIQQRNVERKLQQIDVDNRLQQRTVDQQLQEDNVDPLLQSK